MSPEAPTLRDRKGGKGGVFPALPSLAGPCATAWGGCKGVLVLGLVMARAQGRTEEYACSLLGCLVRRGCCWGCGSLGHSQTRPPDAPWCGHCKALAPEYSKAAALLAAASVAVTLAKVDGPAQLELAEEFGVTEYPTLKFFRHGNRTHPEEYTGPREAERMVEWLRRRVGPSATRLEDEAGTQALIDARDLVVVGFFQDLQDEDVATFLALARDALDMTFGLTDRPQLFQHFGLTKDTVVLFKKVLFVVVDVAAENEHVLKYFGLKAEAAPALRLVNIETTKKYAPVDGDPVTAASVTAFCHAVLNGQVKPYLLSQEVPPDWDQQPVKTLVGKNFEQVAFDETKNVFVKFYAPWCTHCKEMAPAWEALAEKYKDHEDIIIAELDATANELDAFAVHGFPTLKYFPAGPGRKVIEYKSTRDLETLSKFLDNGGELPTEEPLEELAPPSPVGVPKPGSRPLHRVGGAGAGPG
nr:protein disulfide-isomerase A2 isoform X3 [Aotus nancymaae]